MKLLLIEDERAIALALAEALTTTYSVDIARSGISGMHKLEEEHYDVIVLDLNLPDISGLSVCKRLRENGVQTPILILTAEHDLLRKITVLDSGADDYLTKPVSLGELKARLRVLTRRADQASAVARRFTIGDLQLDTGTMQVTREGRIINLRRKEFALLQCLMQHAGDVVSRESLGNFAWQNDGPWTNTIDVHIKYLRDKIDRPFDTPLIKTIHGVGYKLTHSTAKKELHAQGAPPG